MPTVGMARTRAKRSSARPTARGACPNCGELVPRFQHTSDGRAAEVLACEDCGRFAYTSEGATLPLAVPKTTPEGDHPAPETNQLTRR